MSILKYKHKMQGTFTALFLIEMCRNEFQIVIKFVIFFRILKQYATNSQSMGVGRGCTVKSWNNIDTTDSSRHFICATLC